MVPDVLRRAPEGPTRPTPLLFVHGAWHGAWCWEEHYLEWFAARGWDSYALDLRRHGEHSPGQSLRRVRIDDYVADVLGIVEQLPDAPVLIGHSMGGLVVGRVAHHRRLPGAVLLAPVPVGGPWRATLRVIRRHPLAFLRAVGTFRMWPIVADARRARGLLLADDHDDADAARHMGRLGDESFAAYLEMLTIRRPAPLDGKVPLLVVAAGSDALFSVGEQQRTAAAHGARFVVVDGAGHDLMLDPRWDLAAESIASWLEGIAP